MIYFAKCVNLHSSKCFWIKVFNSLWNKEDLHVRVIGSMSKILSLSIYMTVTTAFNDE